MPALVTARSLLHASPALIKALRSEMAIPNRLQAALRDELRLFQLAA
jgi:hypothetical protein